MLGKRQAGVFARTHSLLVKTVQLQSRRGGRFLRPGTDLVDGIERMAKNPIYSH